MIWKISLKSEKFWHSNKNFSLSHDIMRNAGDWSKYQTSYFETNLWQHYVQSFMFLFNNIKKNSKKIGNASIKLQFRPSLHSASKAHSQQRPLWPERQADAVGCQVTWLETMSCKASTSSRGNRRLQTIVVVLVPWKSYYMELVVWTLVLTFVTAPVPWGCPVLSFTCWRRKNTSLPSSLPSLPTSLS